VPVAAAGRFGGRRGAQFAVLQGAEDGFVARLARGLGWLPRGLARAQRARRGRGEHHLGSGGGRGGRFRLGQVGRGRRGTVHHRFGLGRRGGAQGGHRFVDRAGTLGSGLGGGGGGRFDRQVVEPQYFGGKIGKGIGRRREPVCGDGLGPFGGDRVRLGEIDFFDLRRRFDLFRIDLSGLLCRRDLFRHRRLFDFDQRFALFTLFDRVDLRSVCFRLGRGRAAFE